MPELRNRRMVTPLKIGFGMRRRLSSQAFSRNGGGGRRLNRAVKRCRSPEDDKENIPPPGYTRSVWRSPLPDWYPRTPLQDISAIVKAIERKNRRLREQSPQLVEEDVESTPVSIAHQQKKKSLKSEEEEEGFFFFTPPCDALHILLSRGEGSSSASSSSTATASGSRISPPSCADSEEKLTRTIDTIEKMIKESLNRYPKEDPIKAMKRTTLMSMR